MVSLSLLQGLFPTQGLNPGLLLCRRVLYQLSHQGSSNACGILIHPLRIEPGSPERQMLIHGTTWEVLEWCFLKMDSVEQKGCSAESLGGALGDNCPRAGTGC